MRPTSSADCFDHDDDEWCDNCFVPARHATLLVATEAEPNHRPTGTASESGWYHISVGPSAEPLVSQELMDSLLADVANPPSWLDRLSPNAATALTAEYQAGRASAPPRELCVNQQHNHGMYAAVASCARPYPPHPFIHRAVGSAAVWGLVGVAAAAAVSWRAAEWLAERASLQLEVARMRRGNR